MPPKRKSVQDSDASDVDQHSDDGSNASSEYAAPPPKKTAKISNKGGGGTAGKANATPGPRLKKSKIPDWNNNDGQQLTGEYALLPPYNTHITESQWKEYYLERTALDTINTQNSTSSAAEPIESEELGQDTFHILRGAASSVAATIYGAAIGTGLSDDRRTQIARTLRGSLYFTNLWGNDEEGGGDNPRTVNAKTRLYSPFGLGTSIDFSYNFHWRQFRAGEKFSDFVAGSRDIEDCDSKDPVKCGCITKNKNGRSVPSPDSGVLIFDMNNSKIKGTTAAKIQNFQQSLFGCSEWLSPLKMYNLLCAAGTVLHYTEQNRNTVQKAGGEKFKFFAGESEGLDQRKSETRLFVELEEGEGGGGAGEGEDDEICVPQRLLLLARQSKDDGKVGGG